MDEHPAVKYSSGICLGSNIAGHEHRSIQVTSHPFAFNCTGHHTSRLDMLDGESTQCLLERGRANVANFFAILCSQPQSNSVIGSSKNSSPTML